MTSHPSASLYKPTPIEEAYAVYLYDKLFGNFPADGAIHLPAKSTLQVLERANVDSIILTIIWSVVDPDNVKALTDMAQFHVVLRLVALAQDGLLEREISKAFTQERDRSTPVNVFKKALWMSSAYTDCPLPSFQGVTMPDKTFLEMLSNRLQGRHRGPAPAPSPQSTARNARTPAPAPHPISTERPRFNAQAPLQLKDSSQNDAPDTVPNIINIKKKNSAGPEEIESAFHQVESLGVGSVSLLQQFYRVVFF